MRRKLKLRRGWPQTQTPPALPAIVLLASILALALGSNDINKTAGLFGAFSMLLLLGYRELLWPHAGDISRPFFVLIAVLLALTLAIRLGSLIPVLSG